MSNAYADTLQSPLAARDLWRVVLSPFAKLPLEAQVLYIGPFQVSVVANVGHGKIPTNRSLVSDVISRPGALTDLIPTIVAVVTMAQRPMVIRNTARQSHTATPG
ncbi:hypothetical protein BDM02DRAFT_3123952 [Thelephora ganbajun]|uniref:Uncharacterized protein n=1 Tax=Thelephora ganbajun TaxID=370292 RepID=A0ACB6Z146_THEGA|nr:hypothetical protein BDM02DRAFT_3123952 [Thelephora ganbajun]